MARPQDASVDTATMAGETPGRLSLTGPETGKQMMVSRRQVTLAFGAAQEDFLDQRREEDRQVLI